MNIQQNPNPINVKKNTNLRGTPSQIYGISKQFIKYNNPHIKMDIPPRFSFPSLRK